MEPVTVIKVKNTVREELKKIGRKGQSYSEIIESLMNTTGGILNLYKDCEGKLAIKVLFPPEIELNGFLVSKELEKAIVKELNENGFTGAVDLINSCNRWDTGYSEIVKRWYKDTSKKLVKYEISEVTRENIFDEMEDIIEHNVEYFDMNPKEYEKEFEKAFKYVIKKLNVVKKGSKK